jgi:hypothetical protein
MDSSYPDGISARNYTITTTCITTRHMVPAADKRTTSLDLVIDEVYPHTRYDNTAIEEITVWGS